MRNPVYDYLRQINDSFCTEVPDGEMVDVPFGLCIATVDGYVYEVGDTRTNFPIQSISKPFTYGLALSDRGLDEVARRIDVEPSGEAFNEISVSPTTGRPDNPMINSGAITSASLVEGNSPADRFDRVLAHFSTFAGHELSVDEDIYRYEQLHGHRNRAIGHMLREFDILTEEPDEVVDQYLRQCSVSVDCRDLSVMAATFANGGVNPRTEKEALSSSLVEHVLSVMTTCGMYDDAGDWVSTVGLPAKSGVSGGIIAVLPGQLGIAVYSPQTDPHGSSVRGVEACRRLSQDLELHFMHVIRSARSAVRDSYDIRKSPSRRRRSEAEREALENGGRQAHVYELHGDLLFAGAESVVRTVTAQDDTVDLVVLDLRRVDEVADVARRLLRNLRDNLRADGRDSAIVDPDRFLTGTGEGIGERIFTTRNAAIEWCEDELIARHGVDISAPGEVELSAHPLLTNIDSTALEILRPRLSARECVDGETILAADSAPVGIHMILSGQVALKVQLPEGGRRVSTLSAGMSFGELSLVTGQGHQFDFIAEGDVKLVVLSKEALTDLNHHHPKAAIAIWEAMASDAYTLLDQSLREVAAQAEYGS